MNFFDFIKKYKVAISFLIGLLTGLIGSYYKFQSRLDTIDFKLEMIKEQAQKEYQNIYDVLHFQREKINKQNKE